MKSLQNLVLSDKDKRLRQSCQKLDVNNISPSEQELIDHMVE